MEKLYKYAIQIKVSDQFWRDDSSKGTWERLQEIHADQTLRSSCDLRLEINFNIFISTSKHRSYGYKW